MQQDKIGFLQVRDVLVQFRSKNKKHNALKGVSFDINKGEIFSIVGESGSGKTTMARAIAGVQPIKDGSIYLNSRIIRGEPPKLYQINKLINHELKLLENNNIWINQNLNHYLNNAKLNYYKYFTNQKYHIITKTLIPYHHNVKVNNDEDVKKLNLINGKNSQKYFNFVKATYEANLTLLKAIMKKYQRINKFVDGLNQYIPNLSQELENEILIRIRSNMNILQTSILLVNQIYHLLLDLAAAQSNFSQALTIANGQKFYQTSFKIMQQLITYQQEFSKQISAISQNQNITFLLFAPNKVKKQYLLLYHQRYHVFKEQLYQTYQQQLAKLQDANEITQATTLSNKFQIIWLKTKLSLPIIEALIAAVPRKEQLNEYINSLPQTPDHLALQEYFANCQISDNEWEQHLSDLKYLAKNGVFRDYETNQLYYSWNGETYHFSQKENQQSNKLLDLLELELIDKIVKEAELFKKVTKKEAKQQKQTVQMIFQDPYSALNDRIAVSEIITEGVKNFPELYKNTTTRNLYLTFYNSNLGANQPKLTLNQVKDYDVKQFLINSMIKEVGLLPEHLSRYAHEFSGGQRQRIGIARALIMNPQLVIADEPISALDVSIRAQVLNLLKKFQKLNNITYLFIAHDLSIVRFISDRIAVMYNGEIVELAPAEELFTNPLHPYTKALLSAIPQPNPNYEKHKTHFIYQPETIHYDYAYDLPDFVEVSPQHYLSGNQREINLAKAQIAKVKIKEEETDV